MEEGQKPIVLVVDDDREILKLVSVSLRLDGFRDMTTADSSEAVRLVRDGQPSLVILDVKMPGTDGFELCQQIREFSGVPIIMLTARDDIDDIIRGLDLGADDYMVKPFNVSELSARIKAVLHRTRVPQEAPHTAFASGGIVIDSAQRVVRVADREAALPPIEFRLLSLLANNAGKVVTYGHLLSEVWGPEYSGEDTHVLEAAMARLRKRLAEGCGENNCIGTRRGIGYFFNAPITAIRGSAASLTPA